MINRQIDDELFSASRYIAACFLPFALIGQVYDQIMNLILIIHSLTVLLTHSLTVLLVCVMLFCWCFLAIWHIWRLTRWVTCFHQRIRLWIGWARWLCEWLLRYVVVIVWGLGVGIGDLWWSEWSQWSEWSECYLSVACLLDRPVAVCTLRAYVYIYAQW